MTFKKDINVFRRRIMRRITGGIGQTSISAELAPDSIKRVLVSRPNHRLGNQLLVTPLVQEITETFPGCTIDLFVKGGTAAAIFKNYDCIGTIIQLPKKPFSQPVAYLGGWLTLLKNRYDLAINTAKRSSSGRLSIKMARSGHKFFGDDIDGLIDTYPDYRHLAKNPVYNFRHFTQRTGDRVLPELKLKLTDHEIEEGRKKLLETLPGGKETICIYTYATDNKKYPVSWWTEFLEALRHRFPDFQIIEMLPVENVSQLGFSIPSIYSTDIREVASIIANTKIFISADCGIMHLASAAGIPVIGLFSVTRKEIYQPYNCGSMAIDTNGKTATQCVAALPELAVTK